MLLLVNIHMQSKGYVYDVEIKHLSGTLTCLNNCNARPPRRPDRRRLAGRSGRIRCVAPGSRCPRRQGGPGPAIGSFVVNEKAAPNPHRDPHLSRLLQPFGPLHARLLVRMPTLCLFSYRLSALRRTKFSFTPAGYANRDTTRNR